MSPDERCAVCDKGSCAGDCAPAVWLPGFLCSCGEEIRLCLLCDEPRCYACDPSNAEDTCDREPVT